MRFVARRSNYGTLAGGFQGTLKRIGIEFDSLENALRQLEKVASSRLMEPGRWGDAAATNPVNELMSLLSQVLEAWGILRVKKRLET